MNLLDKFNYAESMGPNSIGEKRASIHAVYLSFVKQTPGCLISFSFD